MVKVQASEELLIDILQLLGVDFYIEGEDHNEYHLAI